MQELNVIKVEFNNPLLLDRLNDLSKEYTTPTSLLINVAVKKLINDVDLLRNLQAGKVDLG